MKDKMMETRSVSHCGVTYEISAYLIQDTENAVYLIEAVAVSDADSPVMRLKVRSKWLHGFVESDQAIDRGMVAMEDYIAQLKKQPD